MEPRRPPVELSVEREVVAEGERDARVVRVSAQYRRDPGDGDATPEELGRLLRTLSADLDSAIAEAFPSAGRTRGGDRPIEELVEAYRPRQPELVELLRAEGELSAPEYERLQRYVAGASIAPSSPGAGFHRAGEGEPPVTDRPIAALPLSNDRSPTTARPVAQLLGTFRIETIKQAGAVRARRQISFEEYMSLKRHFASREEKTSVSEPSEAQPTDGRK